MIISQNIINNIVLKNNPNYLIKCICMSDYSLVTLNNKKKRKNNITIDNINEIINDLKENRRSFYNQCSITIKPDLERRPVNIKLFTNGSISMTGCLQDRW